MQWVGGAPAVAGTLPPTSDVPESRAHAPPVDEMWAAEALLGLPWPLPTSPAGASSLGLKCPDSAPAGAPQPRGQLEAVIRVSTPNKRESLGLVAAPSLRLDHVEPSVEPSVAPPSADALADLMMLEASVLPLAAADAGAAGAKELVRANEPQGGGQGADAAAGELRQQSTAEAERVALEKMLGDVGVVLVDDQSEDTALSTPASTVPRVAGGGAEIAAAPCSANAAFGPPGRERPGLRSALPAAVPCLSTCYAAAGLAKWTRARA